jgi:ribosomal protein L37AE/L43A
VKTLPTQQACFPTPSVRWRRCTPADAPANKRTGDKYTPPGVLKILHSDDALAPAYPHTLIMKRDRKESMMEVPITARSYPLRCPFCEVYELEHCGQDSARCPSCEALLSGALLKTLHQITELPDAIGHHACECGHPEMRLLPDGVYRCPACGSEVTPISSSSKEQAT